MSIDYYELKTYYFLGRQKICNNRRILGNYIKDGSLNCYIDIGHRLDLPLTIPPEYWRESNLNLFDLKERNLTKSGFYIELSQLQKYISSDIEIILSYLSENAPAPSRLYCLTPLFDLLGNKSIFTMQFARYTSQMFCENDRQYQVRVIKETVDDFISLHSGEAKRPVGAPFKIVSNFFTAELYYNFYVLRKQIIKDVEFEMVEFVKKHEELLPPSVYTKNFIKSQVRMSVPEAIRAMKRRTSDMR